MDRIARSEKQVLHSSLNVREPGGNWEVSLSLSLYTTIASLILVPLVVAPEIMITVMITRRKRTTRSGRSREEGEQRSRSELLVRFPGIEEACRCNKYTPPPPPSFFFFCLPSSPFLPWAVPSALVAVSCPLACTGALETSVIGCTAAARIGNDVP